MQESEFPILIKSQAHRNEFSTMLLGILLGCVCIFTAFFLWHQYKIHIMIFSIISVLIICISIFKYFEPKFCLGLTDEKLFYYHKQGQWSINWNNVLLIHQPKMSNNVENKNIGFIGIKLRSYDCETNNITPRLANHLLHEQKPLLILGYHSNNIEVEQTQINFSPFKTSNGQNITGPIAAWLHQMKILRKLYGFDLYIPINSFTPSSEQMIKLLKQNQQKNTSYN
ncbi:DUF2982 domain-containing protein [Pseudoalteromonas denitrificans]|uniref:DUF2982 domain-containing protein n=1 Tax=Pseudoalteromonas denitrificans DSM 6059 TaxID=1123010 RepID=A0A1I1QJ65_9GAMM|nr:DUF2982 domain-containing protein [Pseudoalteromonas denitrificans]SFD19888.1 Protein of unknown function [Pseudoalteromonas denitrificans DSM 6059]